MIQSPHNPSAEQVLPVPPRYRWLKRFLKAGGLVLVGLVLLRWWWGHEAHRRLQAEIERIQARGEPIFPEDFDPPEEIPDDQNAVAALTSASENLTFATTAQQEALDGFIGLDDLTEVHWASIAEFERDNAETLALTRKSRSKSKADWGVLFRDPAINIQQVLPSLSTQRRLARVLRRVVLSQHRRGHDQQAIATILDLSHQAWVVDQMPTLVSHLTALAIDALAGAAIERCAHDLAIGELPAVSRETLRDLIAVLLDEWSLRSGLRVAMQVERMFQLDTVRGIVQGRISLTSLPTGGAGTVSFLEDALVLPVMPLFELDGALMITQMGRILRACDRASWPEALEVISPLEREWEAASHGLGKIRRPLSNVLVPSLNRGIFLHYRVTARHRMAAIALAIRLYEVDHGRRPGALAELVPDYLDAVPPDPLAPAGVSFKYLPDAETPILYSVGENGVDDGGLVWDEKSKSYNRFAHDLFFLLDGKLPDPPP